MSDQIVFYTADVEGARHIREYRQLQSKSLKLDRQYASHFEQLLKYLDFHIQIGFIGKQLSIELLLHQGSLLLIDCQCTNELGTASNDELKFHLQDGAINNLLQNLLMTKVTPITYQIQILLGIESRKYMIKSPLPTCLNIWLMKKLPIHKTIKS